MNLSDLHAMLRKTWKHFHSLRIIDGQIHWSIKISHGNLEWFPMYQAPERIELIVNKYINETKNIL